MKIMKKLTPPKEGLDWLLQRTITSLLFLIPKDLEKRNNNSLQSTEVKNPATQKPNNWKIFKAKI